MLYLKKIKKYYLNYFIWFISLIFILTILSYFNIISSKTIKWLKIIIPVFLTSIYSFKSSKKLALKGYLNGVLYGGIIVATLFIINLVFYRIFHLKQTILYIVIILTSILASMLGKTKKSQLKN